MKFLRKAKDGGPESTVTGYWLIEVKWLFSIVLLRFGNGTRLSYHDHAFHSISWLLSGELHEEHVGTMDIDCYDPSLRPIITKRSTFHRVSSIGTSWVLSFRGPWSKTWHELDPLTDRRTTLTHGRRVVP